MDIAEIRLGPLGQLHDLTIAAQELADKENEVIRNLIELASKEVKWSDLKGEVPEGLGGTVVSAPGDMLTAADVDELIAEALAPHTTAFRSVHGISDTRNLVYTSDERLSNSRTPVAHQHAIGDIIDGEEFFLDRENHYGEQDWGTVSKAGSLLSQIGGTLGYSQLPNAAGVWDITTGIIRLARNLYLGGAATSDTNAPIFRINRPGSSPSGSYFEISSPSSEVGFILNRGSGVGTGTTRRWDFYVQSSTFRVRDQTGGNTHFSLSADDTGNVALTNGLTNAVGATGNMVFLPTSAGVPTGTPTASYSNRVPCRIDTTNFRIYVLIGGVWRYAQLV